MLAYSIYALKQTERGSITMKKYFIQYPRNFENEYNLVFCESEEDLTALREFNAKYYTPGHDFERISVRDMRKKISAEKFRRKYDPAFSGYGDIAPTPIKEYVKNYINWCSDFYGEC